MMDNIENVLGIFFRRISADKILERQICGDSFEEREFVRLMRSYYGRYSDTELENMYDYLSENFLIKYYSANREEEMQRGLNVFSLLKCYSSWLLTFQGNEITCEYSKMFHWRNITKRLSEDMIVASFLADRTKGQFTGDTPRFDWKPFLTHNNEELRKIIKAGICENHYHLKGSGPIFQLTWVSLMNDITSREFAENLGRMERDRRDTDRKYDGKYKEQSLLVQIEQAALIRLFLTAVLMKTWITIGRYPEISEKRLNDCAEGDYVLWQETTERNVRRLLGDTTELTAFAGDIQEQIRVISNMSYGAGYPDYAIGGLTAEDTGDQTRLAYQGERWFLYEMLKGIYEQNGNLTRYQDLFYAYLVIKENIRAELIQINEYVGFENFRIYQDRKEFFLELPFFNNLLVKEAVQSSLLDSAVLSLEARIAPKDTAEKMKNQIRKLDSIICGDKVEVKKRIFYTVHFIKTGRDRYNGDVPVMCRHHILRERVRRQALALTEMRERFPEEAARIRGIDAANTEIGCGPEVFAQAFRYLRAHMCNGRKSKIADVPQLHITYHAGEDFLDLVSGLRAIDEAVQFLNMGCGSRLGHALALGVNPSEWYQAKNERIFISQQEYLDNVVWLHHMLGVFRIPEASVLRDYLRRQFRHYFSIIYKGAFDKSLLDYIRSKAVEYYSGSRWEGMYMGSAYDLSPESYYWAWSLRGDDPENYHSGFYENGYRELNLGNRYYDYSVNQKFPVKQEERYFPEAGLLYYLYHYDEQVRTEGQKCIEIKVKPFWQEMILQIQRGMQRKIAQMGIGIETNPSSNCEIGTFKRYDKHPITEFYNRNLVLDNVKLAECEQLNVSINTDDQGVFNTSLENEYAYMALALEKAKDEAGNRLYKKNMIYNWIDDIRKMGIRQTFLSESEMDELVSRKG